MLITKHFVFVHLQKTGGNFIKAVCEQHLQPDWLVPNDLDDHTSFHRIPAEHSHLPVFSLIRNPWDWYVSWYHFAIQSPQGERDEEPDSLWVRLFDRGGRSFEEAVTAACEGNSATPDPPPQWMRAMRERDWDLYTLWYWQLAGRGVDAGRVEVGRVETLREDFIAFLERHDVPVAAAFLDAVRAMPATNTSDRGQYRQYYDDRLRDLVAHKARLIVDRYDYEF
jgi:hypothetical protein